MVGKLPPMRKHQGRVLGGCFSSLSWLRKHQGVGGCLGMYYCTRGVLAQGGGICLGGVDRGSPRFSLFRCGGLPAALQDVDPSLIPADWSAGRPLPCGEYLEDYAWGLFGSERRSDIMYSKIVLYEFEKKTMLEKYR